QPEAGRRAEAGEKGGAATAAGGRGSPAELLGDCARAATPVGEALELGGGGGTGRRRQAAASGGAAPRSGVADGKAAWRGGWETAWRGWRRASRSGKAAASTSPLSTSITSESSPARRQRCAAACGRGAARGGSRERSGVRRPISRSPPPPPPPYGSRRSAAGFARPRRWSSRRRAQLATEICGDYGAREGEAGETGCVGATKGRAEHRGGDGSRPRAERQRWPRSRPRTCGAGYSWRRRGHGGRSRWWSPRRSPAASSSSAAAHVRRGAGAMAAAAARAEPDRRVDDDLEELKGCVDLRFGFSCDVIPELCGTAPVLKLCYSMTQRCRSGAPAAARPRPPARPPRSRV
ncbi:hypothetical protein EE612_054437, partial [Oryza sativa]